MRRIEKTTAGAVKWEAGRRTGNEVDGEKVGEETHDRRIKQIKLRHKNKNRKAK